MIATLFLHKGSSKKRVIALHQEKLSMTFHSDQPIYRSGETGSVKKPKAICLFDFLLIFTPNSSVWVWAEENYSDDH
jgi:hypothetical protein